MALEVIAHGERHEANSQNRVSRLPCALRDYSKSREVVSVAGSGMIEWSVGGV